MKTLLVMRHAKSSWKNADLADHDRPLNKRGKAAAPRMGQLIRAEGLVPDLILSSTAKRAHRTARKAATAAKYEGEIAVDAGLYLASPGEIVSHVRETATSVDRLMIVGHNPGLEDLVSTWTGEPVRFPTAALASMTFEVEAWDAIDLDSRPATVRLWLPRELPLEEVSV